MKTRIAIGVALGLVVVCVVGELQFRVGTVSEAAPPLESAFAQDEPFDTFGVPIPEEPDQPAESFDPFDDVTSANGLSQPVPAGVDEARPGASGSDPFAPDVSSAPGADGVELFGLDDQEIPAAGRGTEESGDARFDAAKQQLRIIRLRHMPVNEVYSIVWNLFQFGSSDPRWFLSIESQSNSLIFKGPAAKFEQIQKLATELDRLGQSPNEVVDHTQLDWGDFTEDDSAAEEIDLETDSEHWQLHILRLRHVKAHEFSGIAESLLDNEGKGRQLRIQSEPKTNSVVMRGPAADIEVVMRLAEQLDQPATHEGEEEDASSEFYDTTELSRDFEPDTNSGWELKAKDHAHELRDQIAMHDRESHEIAREIRRLKERYVSQPAKVAEGHETLTALLERSFQMRLELQELEVAILRNKLAEIESRVKRRSQLRQQIINRRFSELLGEKDDLSWDAAQNSPTRSPFGNPEDERLLIPVESALVKPLPTETTPRESLREGAAELDELRSAPSPKNGFILQQHELIAAEYAVTGAQLRVLHAAKMKNSEANLQTMERHALDYELAVLELERAERLHEELLRHIEASRDSLRLEIRYRQASVELAAAEYQQGVEVNKRLRGTVPEHELRKLQLVLEKAKLSLEQANAELRMLGTQTNGIGKSRSGARKIKPETKVQFEPPAESDLLPVPSKQIDDLDSLPETKTIELPASDKREKVSKPDELPAPSLRKPQPAVEADAL